MNKFATIHLLSMMTLGNSKAKDYAFALYSKSVSDMYKHVLTVTLHHQHSQ